MKKEEENECARMRAQEEKREKSGGIASARAMHRATRK